jgi:hypothetical protein
MENNMNQLSKQIDTLNKQILKEAKEIINLITEINGQIKKNIKQSTGGA